MKKIATLSIIISLALAALSTTNAFAQEVINTKRSQYVNIHKCLNDGEEKVLIPLSAPYIREINKSMTNRYCKTGDVPINKLNLLTGAEREEFTDVINQNMPSGYYPVMWKLTQTKDNTILHCYLIKCSDEIIANVWLGDEHTAIVDMETGVRYIPSGSYDTSIWSKPFYLDAPKGSVLDFPIYFPPLPETTKKIRIYAVGGWNHNGYESLTIFRNVNIDKYDKAPNIRLPRLIKEEAWNYTPDDTLTYAVYDNVHTIKYVPDHDMAIWRTPEKTYLAIAYEQNWNNEYFGFNSKTVLIDQITKKQYKIQKIQGYQLDHLFHLHGRSGDWVTFVLEFEPLPLSTHIISYYEPSSDPFKAWGANWSGSQYEDLSVQQLIEDQKYFDYFPCKVVMAENKNHIKDNIIGDNIEFKKVTEKNDSQFLTDFSYSFVVSAMTEYKKTTPLESAVIVVLSNDNKIVCTAITDAKGKASVKLPKNADHIQINYIGYNNYESNVSNLKIQNQIVLTPKDLSKILKVK